jgi:hypothetical protein
MALLAIVRRIKNYLALSRPGCNQSGDFKSCLVACASNRSPEQVICADANLIHIIVLAEN